VTENPDIYNESPTNFGPAKPLSWSFQ
jgi:hypothetical protein